MSNLLDGKIEKFEKNEDIANEFAYWIENKKYQSDNCVIINGYTAVYNFLNNVSKEKILWYSYFLPLKF